MTEKLPKPRTRRPGEEFIPALHNTYDYLSPEKQDAFLGHLAKTMNVTQAAERSSIETHHLYRVRTVDAEFAQKWQDVLDKRLDTLEEGLWDDAQKHREERWKILTRLRREKWGDSRQVSGKVEHTHKMQPRELTTEQLKEIVEAEYTVERKGESLAGDQLEDRKDNEDGGGSAELEDTSTS
tara:strand:- start:677 stop:1222 length:546 start_codon:yes stop_codon:yes gene_type:complete